MCLLVLFQLVVETSKNCTNTFTSDRNDYFTSDPTFLIIERALSSLLPSPILLVYLLVVQDTVIFDPAAQRGP
jgi:hypothetical protein